MKNLAVFIRAHSADEKTLNLIETLAGSGYYDLYLCVNESEGPIEFAEDHKKVSVKWGDFERLGFPCTKNYTLLYLSDVIFSIILDSTPGYEYYALIEYDVHFQKSASTLLNDLAKRLASPNDITLDLVGIDVNDQGPGWLWYSSASRRYGQVVSSFFPFVLLSYRAILQIKSARDEERMARLRQGHLEEPSPAGFREDWLFCEAFIASELKRAGMNVADLNWIVPQAYQQRSFNVGPAMLFKEGVTYDESVKIVHPVCPVGDTLRKRLYIASTNGTVRDFLQSLDSSEWSVPDDLLAELRGKAEAYLANEQT